MMYPKLFERGKIGNLEIENRIVKAAAQMFPSPDGTVTERLIRYYTEEARGGTGLIIVGLARVSSKETPRPNGMLGVDNDELIPGLAAMVQEIKYNGSKVALQLAHLGSHAYPPTRCVSLEGIKNDIWYPVLHPYAIGLDKYPHKEYSLTDIRELIKEYGDAALRAKAAGFDMVEIHGAHGHGLSCFLSPRTNKRSDKYGGSPKNRRRILLEVISEVRGKVGEAYPICVRLNGTDFQPDGLQIEEALETAREVEQAGADALNMTNENTVLGMESKLGAHIWAAEAVKKVVNIPVMACGSINTPELAEETLEKGRADFIAMARSLFADPSWARKAKEGRSEDIVPCIRCLDCLGPRAGQGPMLCTVNVSLAKKAVLPIIRVERPKKVAIVGGGPAGMEAARVCSLRGHKVTLYEKRKLGGLLNEASVPDFKKDLIRLISYYTNQLNKLQVDVVYRAADIEVIKDGDFDSVIVATGGSQLRPDIQGIDRPNVITAVKVLEEKPLLGEKILIVGGGMIGVEVGLWLADQGKEIMIVEILNRLMSDAIPYYQHVYEERMAERKVIMYTDTSLESVIDGGVVLVDRNGKKRQVRADNIVISTGLSAQTILRDQIEAQTSLDIYAVGDCVNPGRIFDAIHSANICARKI